MVQYAKGMQVSLMRWGNHASKVAALVRQQKGVEGRMTFPTIQRFCPYCGKPRAETWCFCEFCGEPLPAGHNPGSTLGKSETAIGKAGRISGTTALWSKAQEQFHQGNYEGAEQCLQELAAEGMDYPEALALWGAVCLRRYRPDQARELLERAITLAPSSPFVRLCMAEYWLALGIPSRAQEELKTAAGVGVNDPLLYGAIRAISGRVQRANRWSFVRAPAFPSLRGISRLLGVPLVARSGRENKLPA